MVDIAGDHKNHTICYANTDEIKTFTSETSMVLTTGHDGKGPKNDSRIFNTIPDEILNDVELNAAIDIGLPSNYRFEVHKTIWHMRKLGATRIALQLPEGFQRYAMVLSDIHSRWSKGKCEEIVILADVAYGACCIDDFTASSLGCDLLIHYGHSCLIPVTTTTIPCVYVFVEITVPVDPILAVLKSDFFSPIVYHHHPSLTNSNCKSKHSGCHNSVLKCSDFTVLPDPQKITTTDSNLDTCDITSLESKKKVDYDIFNNARQCFQANDSSYDKNLGTGDGLNDFSLEFNGKQVVDSDQILNEMGINQDDDLMDDSNNVEKNNNVKNSSFKSSEVRETENDLKSKGHEDNLNVTITKRPQKIALMSTVQFIPALHAISVALNSKPEAGYSSWPIVEIPQIKPLSKGEVLGCTSPRLSSENPYDAILFIADGRFHLEAAMIANPTIPAYRYDPFVQRVFREQYDQLAMRRIRRAAIDSALGASKFAVVLGTLGRQGSTAVVDDLVGRITDAGKDATIVLMSEIRPEKLNAFGGIFDCWVQTSCPRLSIDWNYTFSNQSSVLTPYELNVLLGHAPAFSVNIPISSHITQLVNDSYDDLNKCKAQTCNCSGEDKVCKTDFDNGFKHIPYPMDFYATADTATHIGPWTPGYHLRPSRRPNK